MLVIHGQFPEAVDLVLKGHVFPERHGLVPVLRPLEVRGELFMNRDGDVSGKVFLERLFEELDGPFPVAGAFVELADADQVHRIHVRLPGRPPPLSQDPGPGDDDAQERKDVLLVMVEDRLDERIIARPDVLEVPPGDFRAGNVLVALGPDNLPGQMEEAAAFILVLPELAGGEEKIEMRKPRERALRPVHGETGFEKRQVERFTVVGDERPDPQVVDETTDLSDHGLLVPHLGEEVLSHLEGAVPIVTHPDQERDRPRSPRQARRLQVQEKGGFQVEGFERLVMAQEGEVLPRDFEPERERDISIARVQVVCVFDELDGFAGARRSRLGRRWRRPRFAATREFDQPLELLFDREFPALVPVDCPPGILDRLVAVTGIPFLFQESQLVVKAHDRSIPCMISQTPPLFQGPRRRRPRLPFRTLDTGGGREYI